MIANHSRLTSFCLKTVLALPIAFPLCAQAATEAARVNDRVITVEEVNKKYQESMKFSPVSPVSAKAVLDDLIKREVAIQEAKRLNLEKDPEVQERMNTVLFNSLIDKQLAKKFEEISITDKDSRDYYQRSPEIRTSHIFVSVRPGASKEEEKKSLEKIKSIQSQYLADGKMSFAEVAQKYSEGIAAPMGGDLDYMTRDKLDPAYYEAAIKLKTPGKVTDQIVRTRYGYHIIKLTAIRSWEETDQGRIKRALFEDKKRQIFETYLEDLQKKSKVSVNKEAL